MVKRDLLDRPRPQRYGNCITGEYGQIAGARVPAFNTHTPQRLLVPEMHDENEKIETNKTKTKPSDKLVGALWLSAQKRLSREQETNVGKPLGAVGGRAIQVGSGLAWEGRCRRERWRKLKSAVLQASTPLYIQAGLCHCNVRYHYSEVSPVKSSLVVECRLLRHQCNRCSQFPGLAFLLLQLLFTHLCLVTQHLLGLCCLVRQASSKL